MRLVPVLFTAPGAAGHEPMAMTLCQSTGTAYGAGMNSNTLLERIWIDPARCGGRPCIRGHRISVSPEPRAAAGCRASLVRTRIEFER